MNPDLRRQLEERQRAFEETLATTEPQYCQVHNLVCEVDRELSLKYRSIHHRICPQCNQELISAKMIGMGVPRLLSQARFSNWQPRDDEERTILATVREYAEKPMGFLLLLGGFGTGKSHLAAACIFAHWRSNRGNSRADRPTGLFLSYRELVRKLRTSYDDRSVVNPVPRCQQAGFLIVDDVKQASGRDEQPMLQEILESRYDDRLPTVLTSNLSVALLLEQLGGALCDRLKQSCFAVCEFNGESHRPSSRGSYFGGSGEDRHEPN